METKESMLSLIEKVGFDIEVPSTYVVDFHGAKNKEGKTSIELSDKNAVACAVVLDKLLNVEQLSGIALCKVFGKVSRLGITGGFENTKQYLKAVTEKDEKTINSMINVGVTLFDVDTNPVVHNIEDFEWSKALEIVTIKKNDMNSPLMGLQVLNDWIDCRYITPLTPLAKLKSWKKLLAAGYIPFDWVEKEGDGYTFPTVIDGRVKTLTVKSLDSLPEYVDIPEDKKQGDGKQGDGKQGDGKQGDGKQEDGKQEDGKQGDGKQEDGKQGDGEQDETVVRTPLMLLNIMESGLVDLLATFTDKERKDYLKAVDTLRKILETKQF